MNQEKIEFYKFNFSYNLNMNNKTRYNIYFFKRFELSKSKNHMYLRINDKTFDCYFCDFCGQYLYNETIICSCNIIEKIFKTYVDYNCSASLESFEKINGFKFRQWPFAKKNQKLVV